MKHKLLRSISVRVPDELLVQVDATCEARAISRSCLFRKALEDEVKLEHKSSDSSQTVSGN